jgi:hypothetical protein
MGTHHKIEDLKAFGIEVPEYMKDTEHPVTGHIKDEDIEIDTSEIYYKLVEVDLYQPNLIPFLEHQVNKFIENASDTFLPSGQPFVIRDGSPEAKLVQLLVDLDSLQE